jgi:hypothetical protein
MCYALSVHHLNYGKERVHNSMCTLCVVCALYTNVHECSKLSTSLLKSIVFCSINQVLAASTSKFVVGHNVCYELDVNRMCLEKEPQINTSQQLQKETLIS